MNSIVIIHNLFFPNKSNFLFLILFVFKYIINPYIHYDLLIIYYTYFYKVENNDYKKTTDKSLYFNYELLLVNIFIYYYLISIYVKSKKGGKSC